MPEEKQSLIDIRCPKCDKLLLRVRGFGSIVELKCDRCGAIVRWPASSMAEVIEESEKIDSDN